MRCDKALRLLAEAWGEERRPAALVRHLERCPACRREAALIETLLGDVRSQPYPEPDESYWQAFVERVQRRIEREEALRRPAALAWLLGRPAWLAAAALALIAISAIWWLRPGAEGPGAGEGDLARLEARLDAALSRATDEDLVALDPAAMLPLPAGADGEPAAPGEAERILLGGEEVLEAAGQLAAALSSEGFPEWGRMDRLVESLDEEEAARLIEDLAPQRSRKSPEGEGAAG